MAQALSFLYDSLNSIDYSSFNSFNTRRLFMLVFINFDIHTPLTSWQFYLNQWWYNCRIYFRCSILISKPKWRKHFVPKPYTAELLVYAYRWQIPHGKMRIQIYFILCMFACNAVGCMLYWWLDVMCSISKYYIISVAYYNRHGNSCALWVYGSFVSNHRYYAIRSGCIFPPIIILNYFLRAIRLPHSLLAHWWWDNPGQYE